MKTFFSGILFIAIALMFSARTQAADTWHQFPAQKAIDSAMGKEKLLPDIRLFMKGQKHPAIEKKIGEFKTNKRTNAFGKDDEPTCEVAFLSALISLQERAQKQGGNAVIDIYSITKDKKYESPDSYSCLTGTLIGNVALMGTVVKLRE